MHLGTYDLEPSEECLDFLKEVLVDVEGPDAGDGAVDAALEKFEELFGKRKNEPSCHQAVHS